VNSNEKGYFNKKLTEDDPIWVETFEKLNLICNVILFNLSNTSCLARSPFLSYIFTLIKFNYFLSNS